MVVTEPDGASYEPGRAQNTYQGEIPTHGWCHSKAAEQWQIDLGQNFSAGEPVRGVDGTDMSA